MTGYGNPYFHYGNRTPKSIWIAPEMRARIIKEGIDKAGSLNALGRVLDYRSRNHPGWSVQQILIGEQAFPLERLERLADFIEIPLEEILKFQVTPEYINPLNTRIALKQYGMLCYLLR
jgi:hypothetical protein